MKKILLLLVVLTFAGLAASVPVYAGVSAAELASLLGGGASGTVPLAVSTNIYQAISGSAMAGYNAASVPMAGSGVGMSLTNVATAEIAAPLARLAGTTGAKMIVKRGLGLLGPVAVAISVGLMAKDLYDLVSADSINYPLLSAATKKAGTWPGIDKNSVIGQNVNVPGYGGRTIVDAEHANGLFYSADFHDATTSYIFSGASQSPYTHRDIFYHGPVAPAAPPRISTQTEFEDTLSPVGAGTPTLDEIYPQYLPEINKATQSLLDAGQAASIPTAKQIENLAVQVAAIAANTAAIAANTAANVATQTAVNTAQNNFNISPTPENKQKLDDAVAHQAEQLAQQAQQVKTDTPTAPPATAAVVPAAAALKSLNLEPLKAINGLLATTYPFNLPQSITSYFAELSGGSGAPVFDLPLPLSQSIHVDLAILDPVAILIRYLTGILVTSGILFYIVHFFRGIS